MSKRKINLEEIIKPYRKYLVEGIDGYKNISGNGMFVGDVLAAMKEACKQALELAAENAELEERDYRKNSTKISNYGEEVCSEYEGIYYGVDKQSILSTINQVE